MRFGLELSFESDRLLFGVGVVRHRDVLFIVDLDFAQDSSVRFDEHAIVAHGSWNPGPSSLRAVIVPSSLGVKSKFEPITG